MSKEKILDLLRDIAHDEGGDVSMRRFVELSGIKTKQIVGAYWPTWNDAKREAGLDTEEFSRERLNEDSVLPSVAGLLASLGRWPTQNEQRLAKKQNSRVPSVRVFTRLTTDRGFLTKLQAYCESTPATGAAAHIVAAKIRETRQASAVSVATEGYVYLMKSGRRYKIGFTSSPTRRHREVRLELPDRTDLVHSIETDDPRGIEAYWHSRFGTKRIRDTEFFELTAADVAAFRKRKFQ